MEGHGKPGQAGAGEGRLPGATRLGPVHLRVADLQRSIGFYRDLVGLRLLGAEGGLARLGTRSRELLYLVERPGIAPRPPRTIGLYHFALLLPNRRALAEAFQRLANAQWPFQGFSDHWVSEAIYLADPDGNGLEIYADRPRDAWRWQNGEVQMATQPLDLHSLVAELSGAGGQEGQAGGGADGAAVPEGSTIGHIHLHVGDLARASAFYNGVLGFDIVNASYPGALFLSAGGYHHHVALNIWAGRNAPRPGQDTAGLEAFTVQVPGREGVEALLGRVQGAGLAPEGEGTARWRLADPDGNTVVIEGTGL